MQDERHRIAKIGAGVCGYIPVLSCGKTSVDKQPIGSEVKGAVGQPNHCHACSGRTNAEGVHGSKRTGVVVSDLREGDSTRY